MEKLFETQKIIFDEFKQEPFYERDISGQFDLSTPKNLNTNASVTTIVQKIFHSNVLSNNSLSFFWYSIAKPLIG